MGSVPASPDAVLHLAALHTLAQAGFASTSQAASMTLTTAITRYLRLVAQSSIERANLAGRSKVAAVDLVQALDDLGAGSVSEIYDWTVELETEVVFTGAFEGLEVEPKLDETLMEMRWAREDEERVKLEDGGMDIGDKEEEDIDGDMKEEPLDIRFTSPDLSWLPPLPGNTPPREIPLNIDSAQTHSAPSATLPITDRYRRAIPYAQSQLSTLRPFHDPPNDYSYTPIPPTSSSFPSLISTYEATASEPSIALRQTPLRQQAVELLRRSIATADAYSPAVTLSSPLPAPRSTPFVPSHSDFLPSHPIPLNADTTGLLSSLVHQINSPQLPPALRERLTSIRPPQPQIRDDQPILYGEPVRGGDKAALARARGKQALSEDEAYLRATWDSGPRGIEKWGRGRLPSGRKVVQSGIGEDRPRGLHQPEVAGARTLRLKLPDSSGSFGPGTERTASTPGPVGLKLKIGGVKREEVEPVAAAERETSEMQPEVQPEVPMEPDEMQPEMPMEASQKEFGSGMLTENGDKEGAAPAGERHQSQVLPPLESPLPDAHDADLLQPDDTFRESPAGAGTREAMET